MGLIRAAKDTIQSMLSDQWREYFYCDALPNEVLVKKGQRRVTGRHGNKGNGDIISNGSVIAVNEGQCMIIVEQGGVVDLCAVAGEYVYDTSTEPSLFYGDLGDNVKKTFATLFERFSFGGSTGKDQRVYFVNMLEIMDNLFGTASPMPFLYVDDRVGFELEVEIRFNGTYSFRITDPLLFYKNVCGNVEDTYECSRIRNTMKAELMQAMQPALAKLGDLRIRVSDIPKHTLDLTEELNRQLSEKWANTRGIEVVSLNMNAPTMSQEAREQINKVQIDVAYMDEDMRMARTSAALPEAMVAAAKNSSGSDRGMLNMGMAMVTSNMAADMIRGYAGDLLQGGARAGRPQAAGRGRAVEYRNSRLQEGLEERDAVAGQGCCGGHGGSAGGGGLAAREGAAGREDSGRAAEAGWTCKCGFTGNRGKFCEECGSPKPAEAGWTCSCGTVNQGKFCHNCGSKRPEGAPLYRCDKCGWEPEDPANPPKFCPECGDAFDDDDKI